MVSLYGAFLQIYPAQPGCGLAICSQISQFPILYFSSYKTNFCRKYFPFFVMLSTRSVCAKFGSVHRFFFFLRKSWFSLAVHLESILAKKIIIYSSFASSGLFWLFCIFFLIFACQDCILIKIQEPFGCRQNLGKTFLAKIPNV